VTNNDFPRNQGLHVSKPGGATKLDFFKVTQVIANLIDESWKSDPVYSTKFNSREIVLELLSSHTVFVRMAGEG
jgi:hypothetical protein